MILKRLTVGNLNLIWKQLDNASGSLYNALENLHDLGFTEKSIITEKRKIADQIARIDVTKIDCLKNEIGEIIDQINQIKEDEAIAKELLLDQE